MTNFENLSELKSLLFDAPSDVKVAFNQVVQFFDNKRIECPSYRIIANIYDDTRWGAPRLRDGSYEALSYKNLAKTDPTITIDRDGNVCKWTNLDTSRFKNPDEQYNAWVAQNKERDIDTATKLWNRGKKREALNTIGKFALDGVEINPADFTGDLAEAVKKYKAKGFAHVNDDYK